MPLEKLFSRAWPEDVLSSGLCSTGYYETHLSLVYIHHLDFPFLDKQKHCFCALNRIIVNEETDVTLMLSALG